MRRIRWTAAPVRRPAPSWGFVVSLAVHVLVGLGLLWSAPVHRPEPPRPPVLEVEILPPAVSPPPAVPGGSPPAARPPVGRPVGPPPPPEASAPAPSPVPPAAAPGPGGMIAATRMLSARILADPRSREAVKTLSQLSGDDRIDQLCGFEALEQIAAWNGRLHPDRVVSYAIEETRQSGHRLIAEGAAVHSGRRWYRLRFTCDLAPDGSKVVGFAFALGAAIPRRDWEGYSLPDEGEAAD
ncbi:DUF930 domain-containing protein [Prosthecodimorpha staleyi]|uniref:DUF930 domain-containing protein n=1 Tax=Prosthecodimorpha staleyi TaxID=2840188 RepID=A0A947D507_9HYPH|nr:DUF930 domain-containing protein [Prosthecodimorpha staleyi]MBT9291135.1 DUF930 domain-containing protein [Prosthecodimorpha staleyi]